jgi:hypothetical protein
MDKKRKLINDVDRPYKKRKLKNPNDDMVDRLTMLGKLGELTQRGIKLTQNYNLESNYQLMKYEYELQKSII